MEKFKSTKIYQFFYKWYMNKYIHTDEFVQNLDFSHSLFDDYNEAIELLDLFKNINEKLNNNDLKNQIILEFNNKEKPFLLTLNNSKDEIFEFKSADIIKEFTDSYIVDNDLFYNDNQILNITKNNNIDFVKHIDGYYKAISKDNKKQLFASVNMIEGESFDIKKITLFDIYSNIKFILKEKLINFSIKYNNEINKMNENILSLNNKVIRTTSNFNILKNYTENDILKDIPLCLFFKFNKKEEFEYKPPKSKYGINSHAKLYFSQERMKSNTFRYDLKNIDIFNNLQKQQDELFNILNNFIQIKYIFSENRTAFQGCVGFLSCQHKKVNRTIFNPLINEYEELYCLEGDVVVSDNRKELCFIKMYYTNHTLLYFSINSKTKEEVKNIFNKGFTNYYQKYRLQESFNDF